VSQFDCQNLTKTITYLSVLKQSLDSGLSNFDAKASVIVSDAAREKIKPYHLLLQLGGEEKIRQRLMTIEIGNESRAELISKVRKLAVVNNDAIKYILDSKKVRIAEKPQKICLIKLDLEELGFKEHSAYFPGIRQQMSELGLSMCPPETAFHLSLQGEENLSFGTSSGCVIAMEPVPGKVQLEEIFRMANTTSGNVTPILVPAFKERSWHPDEVFIFRLADDNPLISLSEKE
jgi:hypothetical protein